MTVSVEWLWFNSAIYLTSFSVLTIFYTLEYDLWSSLVIDPVAAGFDPEA